MKFEKQYFTDNRACESVDMFYHGKTSFVAMESLEFKASLGGLLNQIERVFRGVFGKGYQTFNEDDLSKFKRIFPTAWKVFSKVYPDDTAKSIRLFLTSARNINVHARDYATYPVFRVNERAKFIPNQNERITMVADDGFLTLAGLITMLFMFSNAKMVEYLVKSSSSFKILNVVVKPVDHPDKMNSKEYGEFIQEKIGMRDEELIRTSSSTVNVFEAIFGDFANKVVHKGNDFKYFNGLDEENSDCIVSGSYIKSGKKHVLRIDYGSIYIKAFKEDFVYNVTDEKEFIDECLKLPPFIYILLLEKTKKMSKKDYDEVYPLFEKLNHPKFYVDKSIDVLFFGNKFSDFRGICASALPLINYCLLNMEDMIYGYCGLELKDGYSRLQDALINAGVNRSLAYDVGMLRNYLSHGYNIGDEYITPAKNVIEINLEYIIDLLIRLGEELNKVSPKNGSVFMGDLYHRIVCNLVAFKYYDSIALSEKIVRGCATKEEWEHLRQKNIRVAGSYFTDEIEEKMLSVINKYSFNYNNQYFKKIYAVELKGNKVFKTSNGLEVSDTTLYFAGHGILEQVLGIFENDIKTIKDVGFKKYVEIK